MKNAVVVGLGAISKTHIDAILTTANLYGVCDIERQKADEIAIQNNCKAFYHIEDVVKDEAVDSVHICTPHYLHLEMAVICSEFGKEIVLEKPAVMNLDEFDILSKVIEKNNTKCMIVLQNRYNPCINFIKENISQLNLGNLIGIKGVLTWHRDEEYYKNSNWRGKYKTEGGGFVINQAPHTLDLISYFGGEIENIKGSCSTRVLSNVIEVEDTAEATIYFKSGIKGFFYGTNGYPINSSYDLELAFENGVLKYNYGRLTLNKNNEFQELEKDDYSNSKKSYWGNSHNYVIRKFYTTDDDFPSIMDYEPVCKIIDNIIKNKGE